MMTAAFVAFVAWVLVFLAFVLGLWRDHRALRRRDPAARSPFSDTHHAFYFSTLYWMAAACLPALHARGWVTVCALVVCWLGMADDASEHWGGPSVVHRWYGRLGGTW